MGSAGGDRRIRARLGKTKKRQPGARAESSPELDFVNKDASSSRRTHDIQKHLKKKCRKQRKTVRKLQKRPLL